MNVLTLLIWTTKALVLCGHEKTKEILNELIRFLGDDHVGGIAAAGFDIILRDSDEVIFKILYLFPFLALNTPTFNSEVLVVCISFLDFMNI